MSESFVFSGGQIYLCALFGAGERGLGGGTRAHRQMVQCPNERQ